jgi:hypothetical protein
MRSWYYKGDAALEHLLPEPSRSRGRGTGQSYVRIFLRAGRALLPPIEGAAGTERRPGGVDADALTEGGDLGSPAREEVLSECALSETRKCFQSALRFELDLLESLRSRDAIALGAGNFFGNGSLVLSVLSPLLTDSCTGR